MNNIERLRSIVSDIDDEDSLAIPRTFVEKLLEETVVEVCGSNKVCFDGKDISFARPYKRVSFFDAIKNETGDDISKMTEDI